MDPWFASPVIFFVGFILLYSKWVIARIAGVCIIVGALAIAWSPGDVDDWYMAIILSVIGAIILILFRPRWLVYPAAQQTSARWQFSLRQLLIAMVVFNVCTCFLNLVFRHLWEQYEISRLVHPILQNYVSTVGFENGDVVWLSMNDSGPLADDVFQARLQFGDAHFCAATKNARQGAKSFGDVDLVEIVSEHGALRVLDLRQTEVTDRGLVHLSELAELEWLWLDPSQCTEIGLAHLEGLTNLRELIIDDEAASPESLTRLHDALPKCQIRETRVPARNSSLKDR